MNPSASTPVYAISHGQVEVAVADWQANNPGQNPCGDNRGSVGLWGNYVVVRHDNVASRIEFDPFLAEYVDYSGTIRSVYAHLIAINPRLSINGYVLRGTLIGYTGSTGSSSGPHLHYQVDKAGATTPFWPTGCAIDEPSTACRNLVRANTHSPMRFVQVHLVEQQFNQPGATETYFSDTTLTTPSIEPPISTELIDYDWYVRLV